jgi:hypothetical protein
VTGSRRPRRGGADLGDSRDTAPFLLSIVLKTKVRMLAMSSSVMCDIGGITPL